MRVQRPLWARPGLHSSSVPGWKSGLEGGILKQAILIRRHEEPEMNGRRKPIRLWIGNLLVLLGSTAWATPQASLWSRWEAHEVSSTYRVDHAIWDALLKTYVMTEHPSSIYRIRYKEFAPQDGGALAVYLERLQQTRVSELNREEQMAYWVNLYNARTIKLVLDHYPVESIRDIHISPGLFSRGPWGAKLLRVEGEAISLDDIEHRILRPIWKDNRIHYALNCASLGCPNLQPEAFTRENAARLMDKGAREYVNHPRGARWEAGGLVISAIYDWFQVDFRGTEEGVLDHLSWYAEDPLRTLLKGFKGAIRYEYDWRLNEP
jgi:hypothetical protein